MATGYIANGARSSRDRLRNLCAILAVSDEATNGIQALDLLGPQVLMSQGKDCQRAFTKEVHQFLPAAITKGMRDLVVTYGAKLRPRAEIPNGAS